MGKKVFVGNLSFRVTEEAIRELFSTVGMVESIKLITDMHTGRPKGFGFVEMASDDEAEKAIETLNGTTFMERSLLVERAKPPRREKQGFDNRRPGGFRDSRAPRRGRR